MHRKLADLSSIFVVALTAVLAVPMSAPIAGAQSTQEPAKDERTADAKPQAPKAEPPSTTDQDANSDDKEDTPPKAAQGVTHSNPVKAKWKISARIVGGRGVASNMIVTMPVPVNWPEQTVGIVSEDIPAAIGKVAYRELDNRVRQMVVAIPYVRAGEEIIISMTFVVSTSEASLPPDTTAFVAPEKSHKEGRLYLRTSPQISFSNSKLRKQVKELTADKPNVWEEVKAIYNWVDENIVEEETEPKDSVKTFRDLSGCNEDRVGLFVAMCRYHKIPARIVWIEGGISAEFMLADAVGNGHWIPCSLGGIREFGQISEPRMILQKGDSVRVPEKEGRQKFVGEFAVCQGRAKPSVKFYRELLAND